MSSEWDSDSPSPRERTLKSSTSKIPTEKEDRPILNGDAYSYASMRTRTHLMDHLRLQVAVKRGTLLRIASTVIFRFGGECGGRRRNHKRQNHKTTSHIHRQEEREHTIRCTPSSSAHASYEGYGCNKKKPPRPPHRNTMIDVGV
jgi:hypothetical protein